MYILGINAYHGDSSAAIVENGIVIAAAEEERFTRQKHWAGVPLNAIDFCLKYVEKDISDIAHIAINSDGRAHKWKKLKYVLTTRPGFRLAVEKVGVRSKRKNILADIEQHTGHDLSGIQLHFIEHHLAHLASAYFPSEFDSAAVLSIDGFGDFSSGAWGYGRGSEISISSYNHFPHSMGIFYQAITQLLGFPEYGDEYKVMGLASYGRPEYINQMRNLVETDVSGGYSLSLSYFRHHRESLAFQWVNSIPKFDNLYSNKFEQLLGAARLPDQPIDDRHRNIAASAQALFEEVLFNLLNRLYEEVESPNLALAGGCAMNSVANGKIKQNTKFRNVYVQPAAGDAGGAIGSALMVSKNLGNSLSNTCNKPVMRDAYLGPKFSAGQVDQELKRYRNELNRSEFQINCWTRRGHENESEQDLLAHVASRLDNGAIVGWFQGRMEWGPRALGNRSILADPRRTDIQELLNAKIKRRESFRPFAPSILRDQVSNWFEVDDEAPFMEKVYPIRKDKQNVIPAVTHIDGTGRLQTVDRESNPRYYGLIEAFNKLTSIPILLNTSFNENEPIVCTPEQALQCFLRTKMDLLVLENFTITRKQIGKQPK